MCFPIWQNRRSRFPIWQNCRSLFVFVYRSVCNAFHNVFEMLHVFFLGEGSLVIAVYVSFIGLAGDAYKLEACGKMTRMRGCDV